MNVLIVDDEKIMIETIRRGLRTKGFNVIEALNGKDAIDLLHGTETIDIVITDYSMPGMNGIELLEKIRLINNDVPVIMMTAYSDKELVIDAMKNKCNGFIDKPFSLEELLAEIYRNKN